MNDYSILLNATNETEQIKNLIKIKNQLTGFSNRKLSLLRESGAIERLVHFLVQPNLELCLQSTAILTSISQPTKESAKLLLSARTHKILIILFTSTYSNLTNSMDELNPARMKLLETLLRGIRKLYVDLIQALGPKNNLEENQSLKLKATDPSSSSIDTSVKVNAIKSTPQKEKGKGKETDLDLKYQEAVQALYADDTEILILLLTILRECSLSSTVYTSNNGSAHMASNLWSTTGNKLKIAELICSLLSETLRTPEDGALIAKASERVVGMEEDRSGVRGLHDDLTRLIQGQNGKVQESAVRLFTTLMKTKFNFETGISWDPMKGLMYSQSPSLRLAMVACGVVVLDIYSVDMKEAGVRFSSSLVTVLHSLLSTEVTSNESILIRQQSAFIFATLLSKVPVAMDQALELHLPSLLYKILLEQCTPSLPESSLQKTREGVLLILATLAAASESNRVLLISYSTNPFSTTVAQINFLPIIIVMLEHPSNRVKIAVCHVLRMLTRSVNILRTSLVDTGVVECILKLLSDSSDNEDQDQNMEGSKEIMEEDEDEEEVKIGAVRVVANLLLEFSPLRVVLLKGGCVSKVCKLAKSENQDLKISALRALKNATYESNSDFKRSMMEHLTWSTLRSLIADTNLDIKENSLGILRNVVCTHNNDPILPFDQVEMGNGVLLSLIENSLEKGNPDAVVETALFVLVNLATANQASRKAIASRAELLPLIISYLDSPNNKVRSGSVWSIINLCQQDKAATSTFYAQSNFTATEIGTKLRSLGVELKLKGMMVEDVSLDIRERARDGWTALRLLPIAYESL